MREDVILIEVPFITGSKALLTLKEPKHYRTVSAASKRTTRPKTVSTVFRSKSCEPNSRKSPEQSKPNEQTVRDDDHDILKPCWK